MTRFAFVAKGGVVVIIHAASRAEAARIFRSQNS